ncbi:MAG TPA: hypothetical protein VIY48_15175 [Candidatus Paceibacterota bacterium]
MPVEPTYSISEVSKILEMSVYWLRWKEKKMIEAGTFVRQDGTPLQIARSLSHSGTVESYSRRKYTIRDIEDMAKLFMSHGVYSDSVYSRVINKIILYKSMGEVD